MLQTRRQSVLKLLRDIIRATKSDVFIDSDFYRDEYKNCRYDEYFDTKVKQIKNILI